MIYVHNPIDKRCQLVKALGGEAYDATVAVTADDYLFNFGEEFLETKAKYFGPSLQTEKIAKQRYQFKTDLEALGFPVATTLGIHRGDLMPKKYLNDQYIIKPVLWGRSMLGSKHLVEDNYDWHYVEPFEELEVEYSIAFFTVDGQCSYLSSAICKADHSKHPADRFIDYTMTSDLPEDVRALFDRYKEVVVPRLDGRSGNELQIARRTDGSLFILEHNNRIGQPKIIGPWLKSDPVEIFMDVVMGRIPEVKHRVTSVDVCMTDHLEEIDGGQ